MLFMQFMSGLTYAMVVFLIASGLSLIFGVLGVLNMAHGSFYMLGAYLALTLVGLVPKTMGPFWIAVVIAPLGVAALGGIVEVTMLRGMIKREVLYQLLLTYGLVLIFSDATKFIWGTDNKSVTRPAILGGSVTLMGRDFPSYYFLILIIAPLVALGLWLMLHKTKIGQIIRAATFDREMVGALGINVKRIFTMVFILGCWLGGLGGTLAAPMSAIAPGMDVEVLIESFIVVVIGGLGSFGGALLGSLILGQISAFGILIVPRLAMIFAFLLMIIILIFRPWGLLGKKAG